MAACLLAGCIGGGREPYWAIFPVHEVRNSPIPVPRPQMKPTPPVGLATVAPQVPDPATPPLPPGTATVTVRRGDTVYGIAQRHGLSVEALCRVNDLDPPYLLRVGQSLHLPPPRLHVVRGGETAFSIARKHDLALRDLADANRLAPPYLLRVGDRLRVPSGRSEEVAVASRPSRGLPPPPPRAGNGFAWPVAGAIVSRFGPKDGGLRNDGINIGAPRGAPVRASESGVVAYAGSGLRGFGNLVLVRHADDWVTAYAHNDELLVARGDRVERGQAIARAGSTGGVVEPQLHFEIRRGTRAVDPLAHLPRLSASAR